MSVRSLLIAFTAMLAPLLASCGDSGSGSQGGGGSGGGPPMSTATTGGSMSSGGGGAGGSVVAGSSGSGGDPGCKGDADCAAPLVCDLDTGECVNCTPENDICAEGLFCTSGN